jgi:hypothetical protein
MKIRTLIASNIILLALAALSAQSAESMTKFTARSGSKMRIDGTANMIHEHWRVESPIIGGYLEVGPGFPTEPGQAATPGKVAAQAQVFILVSSLKSVEEDGKPYSDAMDEIMYEKLKSDGFKKIDFHLTELTLKESAKDKDAPYVFDAKGDLTIAGVTNSISMPVNVLLLADKKMKITGSVSVKMTSFKIDPPAPKVALGMLKTGDDVKLSFEWMLGPARPAAK